MLKHAHFCIRILSGIEIRIFVLKQNTLKAQNSVIILNGVSSEQTVVGQSTRVFVQKPIPFVFPI